VVQVAGVPLHEAVRMATQTPARLLGMGRRLGTLAPGAAADLVVFDRAFTVEMTLVSGTIAFQRGARQQMR
jgi:N-acetylglucosamine-6-phosphate deacetylase